MEDSCVIILTEDMSDETYDGDIIEYKFDDGDVLKIYD